MNSKWQTKKLGEICEVVNRGISPKYTSSEGVCVLNQKCIRDHKINFDLSRMHDFKTKNVSYEKFIKVGDVLVNSTGTGTLGRVAQVKELPFEATVDSHITIVRPMKNIFNAAFFGYALIFIEEEIAKKGEGCGGQTELARNTLKNDFSVAYPESIIEQKHIVRLLEKAFSAIDKAKSNAQQNLKNSKELFKSYLQELFGNNSDGWQEVKLSELTIDITDGDHMPPPKTEVGVPFITISNINKQSYQIDFSDTFSVSTSYFQKLKENRKPRKGDILYTVTGSYGIPVLIEDDLEFCFQRHIGLIRPKETVNSKWLYYWILSPQALMQANNTATGTAQKTVSLTALRNFSLPKMSLKIQKSIIQKLDALSVEIKQLEITHKTKINDLEELKKSVLQKAFSGELVKAEVGV